MPSMIDYDDYQLTKFSKAVESTVEALESRTVRFDSIVVRGVSGLIVGAPVAHLIQKPIVVVRKEGVSSHTSSLISNFGEIGGRYVVVDDFVSSGGTLMAIRSEVDRMAGYEGRKVEYVGLYEYWYERWYRDEKMSVASVPDLSPWVVSAWDAAGCRLQVRHDPTC